MRFRGLVWSKEETEMMLQIIKKNKLLASAPSHTQLGHTLEPPMKDLGYDRSAQQIRFKLKALRANYIHCQRKGCTPKAMEECPFFDLLDELYWSEISGKNDTEMEIIATESSTGFSSIWTDEEMRKMLSLIDMMNLSDELSLHTLVPSALKLIGKGMVSAGYHRNARQIHTVLTSLRAAYIKCRIAEEKEIECEPCPYFDIVDKLWGSEEICSAEIEKSIEATSSITIKTQKSKNNLILKRVPHDKILWTKKETQALLDCIDELNLTGEFQSRMAGSMIEKLVEPLKQRGYERSSSQILGKIKNLRSSYFKCIQAGRKRYGIYECPYFDRLEKMFIKYKKFNTVSKLQLADHNYGNDKSIDHSYVSTVEEPKETEAIWQPIESIVSNEDDSSFMDNFEDYEETCTEEEIVIHCENVDEDENDENPLDSQESELNPLDDSPINESIDSDEKSTIQIKKEIPVVHLIQLKTPHVAKVPLKIIRAEQRDRKSQFVFDKIKVATTEQYTSPIKSSTSPITTSASLISSNIPSATIASSFSSSVSPTTSTKNPTTSSFSIPSTSTATTAHETITTESITALMEQFIKHDERMQQQNHEWMEQQFAKQREHDHEQRELLINELREFRKIFASTMSKKKGSSPV